MMYVQAEALIPGPESFLPLPGMGMGVPNTPPPGVDAGPWECKACTFINPSFGIRCGACNTRNRAASSPLGRPGGRGMQVAQPVAGAGGGGFLSALAGAASQPAPRWVCHSCNADNHPQVMWCKECQTPNPHAGQGAPGCVVS